MTPEQFVYWLQGYVEINGDMPTGEQWENIKNRLQTVSHQVTPSMQLQQPFGSNGTSGTEDWWKYKNIC